MKTDRLDIYSDCLISHNHHATATGLAAMFDGEISHDFDEANQIEDMSHGLKRFMLVLA